LFASALDNVVVILQFFCVVGNFNYDLFEMNLFFYPFCHAIFSFLVIVLQLLSFWWFNVNLPMLLYFIYNFCMFKWWYHGYFVILNIVASFISDLFQIVCCVFVVVKFCCLKIFIGNNKKKSGMQCLHFLTNHNLQGQNSIFKRILHHDLHSHDFTWHVKWLFTSTITTLTCVYALVVNGSQMGPSYVAMKINWHHIWW
jgi:hypothetical protein